MVKTSCAICGSYDDFEIMYKSNFTDKDLNTDVFSARRLPDGSHYQIVKCKKDGLVRSNPILEPDIISRLYKDSKFTYENEVANLEKSYINVLTPLLSKISKSDNILEIGCGNGFVLNKLYKMGFNNVFGIDPSIAAQQKADTKIMKNILVSILKPGIFKTKKFNLIFFFQTLDHIPNPDEFIKNCYQLLEKGGYILAFNHNIESLSAKILGEKSVIIDIEHTFLYSPSTIKKLFEKNNLRPIKVFSPFNIISLKYLIQLLPLPIFLKKIFLVLSTNRINFKLQLGNLCIIARK